MGDTHYDSVVLLLHGDGANNAVVFTDNSPAPKAPAVFGNAKISTAQSKFGGASMAFDGSGDYLLYADAADWVIGDNDFTIEAFVYRAASGVMHVIASQWSPNTATDNAMLFYVEAGNKLTFSYGSGSTNAGVLSAASVPSGQWVHVAACRRGSTVHLFIDGVLDANTLTAVGALNDSPHPFVVGAYQNGSLGNYTNGFNGYIDDLRFTNGVCRYTATFTPPTAPHPDYVELSSPPPGPPPPGPAIPTGFKPIINGYRYGSPGGVLMSEVGGGMPRVAAAWMRSARPFDLTFIHGTEKQKVFEAWFTHVIKNGSIQFWCPMDSGFGLQWHLCVIVPGTLSVMRAGGQIWSVAFTVIAEPAAYGISEADALGIIEAWEAG